MRSSWLALVAVLSAGAFAVGPAGAYAASSTPLNVDVTQRLTNESEEAIAVNPTNPNNIVEVSNVEVPAAGLLEAISFDGGSTWTTKLIADNDNLGAACSDPSLSFDHYGNLFLTYLYNLGNTVPVALSTDGGLHFDLIANIAKPPKSDTNTSGERATFRFVDQPTITSGQGEVWIVFNAGGPMVATGGRSAGSGRSGASSRSRPCPGRTTVPTAMSRS